MTAAQGAEPDGPGWRWLAWAGLLLAPHVLTWHRPLPLAALMAATAALLLSGLLRQPLRAPPAVLVLAGLWLAWCAVAGWASDVRELALFGALLLAAGPLAMLATLAGRWPALCRARLDFALRVLAACLAAGALLQKYVLGLAPAGTFLNPNSLAGWLLLVALPLGAELLAGAARRPRAGAWLFFLLSLAIAASLSRGALLAYWLGLVLLLVLGPRPAARERRVLLAAGLWAVLLAQVLSAGALGERLGSALGTLALLGEGGSESIWAEPLAARPDTAVNERFLIWSSALAMLREAPWHGIGPGTFQARYPAYRSPADTSAGQYAHNDYLQILIELGWPGLLILAALAVVTLRRLPWQRSRTEGRLAPAALGPFAALMAFFAHSALSFNLYILPSTLLAGVLLGRLVEASPAARRPVRRVIGRRALGLSAVLLAVLAGCFLYAIARMQSEFQTAQQHLAAGRLEAAERDLREAAHWFDTSGVRTALAGLYAGAMDQVGGDRPRRWSLGALALEECHAAQRLNPHAPLPWLVQAEVLGRLGLRESAPRAAAALQAALARDPRFLPARLALADLLGAAGRPALRLAVLEAGARYGYELRPVYLAYLRRLAGARHAAGDARGAGRAQRLLARYGGR